MASMPTQRWKQEPVFWPSSRCILTFLARSSRDWWMWANRLMVRPVRWLVAVMRSAYSGCWASSYVMAMELMLGRMMGWLT